MKMEFSAPIPVSQGLWGDSDDFSKLVDILEYVRSFRRKVLRTLYIQRLICSKQEYFFFREYSIVFQVYHLNTIIPISCNIIKNIL